MTIFLDDFYNNDTKYIFDENNNKLGVIVNNHKINTIQTKGVASIEKCGFLKKKQIIFIGYYNYTDKNMNYFLLLNDELISLKDKNLSIIKKRNPPFFISNKFIIKYKGFVISCSEPFFGRDEDNFSTNIFDILKTLGSGDEIKPMT